MRSHRRRALLLLPSGLGLSLLVLARAADWLGLSQYPDLGPGEALLATLGLSLLTLPWLLFAATRPPALPHTQRVARVARDLAAWTVGVALALIAWEGIARAWVDAPTRPPPHSEAYYEAQTWGRAWWEEYAQLERRYHPLVTWRHAPHTGPWITIDAAGERVTPDRPEEGPETWVLGGSTVWGYAVPDAWTLPARLQHAWPTRQVRNLGEVGWTSGQSLACLVEELRAGRRPDAVLAYEGLNDVYAAYQQGAPGQQNDGWVRARFEAHPLAQWLSRSWWVQVLGRRLHRPQTYATLGVDVDALADAVVARYLGGVRILRGLGAQHGFAVRAVWQPSLATTTKTLTPDERAVFDALDPDLVALAQAVDARVRGAEEVEFAGEVLGEFEGRAFVDLFHLTAEANAHVAERLAR